MSKKIRPFIVAALIVALVLAISGCKSQEQLAQTAQPTQPQAVPDVYVTNEAEKSPDVITVSGEGEVKLTPDVASFSVRVRTEDADAETAQKLNTEATDAVIAALKAAGVAEKDIATTNLDLDERYDYSKEVPELIGYTMNHELSVTVRDIAKLGQVISDAISAGATETFGLNFTVSSSDSAYADALKTAVATAKAKAEALAEALNVELNPMPVKVDEMSSSYSPTVYRDMNVAAPQTDGLSESATADMGASISTGELSVTARVDITYEITPKA